MEGPVRLLPSLTNRRARLPADSPAGNALADQVIENIVVEWDTFAGACAFDVLSEIDPGKARATDRAIPDSPNNLLELLLLPDAVARILGSYDFFDKIFAMPISA